MEDPPNDEEEIQATCAIVACGATVYTPKEERVLTGTFGEFRFIFSISSRAGDFIISPRDFDSSSCCCYCFIFSSL